ncbi:hypothetical protein [Breoghania sp. L-A4]|uniref:hypothetical protein n=1 Tax=Breoghania sp. L-A4 TaxID=2304600 RepID=UPI0013C32E3C|nr:hypothetical protein [Breoghania sp. L-A4]
MTFILGILEIAAGAAGTRVHNLVRCGTWSRLPQRLFPASVGFAMNRRGFQTKRSNRGNPPTGSIALQAGAASKRERTVAAAPLHCVAANRLNIGAFGQNFSPHRTVVWSAATENAPDAVRLFYKQCAYKYCSESRARPESIGQNAKKSRKGPVFL